MRIRRASQLALLAILVSASGGVMVACEKGMPTLTPAETKEGWKLLFDGKSLSGWQGYKGRPTSGWKAADGVLIRDGAGSDLVSLYAPPPGMVRAPPEISRRPVFAGGRQWSNAGRSN